MKGLTLALIFIASAMVNGCANYQKAIMADSVTTLISLQQESVAELNPIFRHASPTDTAFGVGFISVLAAEFAKRSMPINQCESFLHALTSIKYGAAINNLAVLAGGSGALPLLIGAGVGIGIYQSDLARDRCD